MWSQGDQEEEQDHPPGGEARAGAALTDLSTPDPAHARVVTEDLRQFLSQSNSSLFLALKAPN